MQPHNLFQVVTGCFQILPSRFENSWCHESDLVVAPGVRGVDWNAFSRGPDMEQAGEAAARASISRIREWLPPRKAAVPLLQ